MQLPVISLALTSIIFGVFGMLFLINPNAVSLAGLEIVDPAGLAEVSGFYGGFEIGMAIFFALSVYRKLWFKPALAVQCLALGGMAFGRIVAIILYGAVDVFQFYLITAEIFGMTLGLVAIYTLAAKKIIKTTDVK